MGLAPTAFLHEIFKAPRSWADRVHPNLSYWERLTEAAIPPASEEPDLFVTELRAAFRSLR